MTPARAQAAARADEVAPSRRTAGPARLRGTDGRPQLRSAEVVPGRLARVGAVLQSGNLLGRVGTLTALALFVSVFGVVVFQALLVQGQARLDHLNAQIATQQQTSKQLELRLAQLDSPARIVTAARALGMIDAGDVVYLQPAASDDAAARWTPTPTTAPTTTTPTTSAPTTTLASPTTTVATTPTTVGRAAVGGTGTGNTTATSVKATRP